MPSHQRPLISQQCPHPSSARSHSQLLRPPPLPRTRWWWWSCEKAPQRSGEPPPGSTSPACRQGCSLPKPSCCVEDWPVFLNSLSGSDASKVSILSGPRCHGPSLKRHDLQELAGECDPLKFLSTALAGALLAIPGFTKMARMLRSVDNLGPRELHHPRLWLMSDL